MKKKKQSLTVYFASELFSLKHLIGNAYLAEAIYEKSHGRYLCVLPQNLEQRGNTAKSIRDQDILTLLGCDLGLFNYDGTELDSGTVVEFMFAKFADIPSVILRSDFRQGGDQRGAAAVQQKRGAQRQQRGGQHGELEGQQSAETAQPVKGIIYGLRQPLQVHPRRAVHSP